MTTNNHTPISTGAAANASTFNAPLGALDAAIGNLNALTTTVNTDIITALNELEASKLEANASASLIAYSPHGTIDDITVQNAISHLEDTKQPVADNLTDLGGMVGQEGDIVQYVSGSWINRTLAQLKEVLGLLGSQVTNIPNNTTGGGISSTTVQAAINELDGDKAPLVHTHSASSITNLSSLPIDTLGYGSAGSTDLDSNTSRHGLMAQLTGVAQQIFTGTGAWTKWAMGIKKSGGLFSPRSYIEFEGAGVTVGYNEAEDAIQVVIPGGGEGSAASNIDDLGDVTITSETLLHKNILYYDKEGGLQWRNAPLSLVTTQGHVIGWNGVSSGLTPTTFLNFVGSGVSVADSTIDENVVTQVTIQGGESNYLINGGFNIMQRWAEGANILVSEKCAADRWRTAFQNASLTYTRVENVGETGITSRYYGRFEKITSTGKFIVFQVIEGVNSIPLRNQYLTFAVKMKVNSGTKNMRIAILQNANTGTLDYTGNLSSTTWGTASVDPTMNANCPVISTAETVTVTTAWTEFYVRRTIPATAKNVICAIWTDSAFSSGEIIDIGCAGLYIASAPPIWRPQSFSEEIINCQRYYEKSYSLDVKPGTMNSIGFISTKAFAYNSSPLITVPITFQVTKRGAPSVSTYDNIRTGAGTQASPYVYPTAGYGQVIIVSGAEAARRPMTIETTSTRGFNASMSVAATATTKAGVRFHFIADAEIY